MTADAFAHHHTTQRALAHRRDRAPCHVRLTGRAFAHSHTTPRGVAHIREVSS